MPRMKNDSPINPYHAGGDDTVGSAPFAGRQDAFGRLYGLTSDPARSGGFLFLGRKGIGKTALLRAIGGLFKDTAISAILPLRDVAIEGESAWLLTVAQSVTAVLIERGFTLSRLSMIEAPGADMRRWLEDVFFPHVFATIRTTRQLLLLFDDADRLLMAIKAGTLPPDTLVFFTELLKQFRQLQIVFTLDTEYEAEIKDFGALIDYQHIYRLSNLSPDEVKWLLTEPVRDYYIVPDEVARAVVAQTGGAPALAQRYGDAFFRRWYDAPDLNVITPDDARTITAKLYQELRPDLRLTWDNLTVNERLVLTAIIGAHYDDPLAALSAESLHAWLVETDYPLDTTAISAALRGLEYRELIAPQDLAVTAGLMKTWLLENARTVQRSGLPRPERTETAAQRLSVSPRVLRLLLIALVVLIIANVIAFALVERSPTITVTVTPPPPTVTLAQPTP